MSHRILAIDVASTTGWCTYHSDTDTIEAGEVELKRYMGCKSKPADHEGIKFLQFREWLSDMLFMHEPTHIVYERPGHLKGVAAMESLLGFRGVLYYLAAKWDIPIATIAPATLKKWATGYGRADKEQMKAEAVRRCPSLAVAFESDNAADAYLLMEWFRVEW